MFSWGYNSLDSQVLCTYIIGRTRGGYDKLESYLIGYQLPEDLFITPTTTKQYFTASAKNRYIRSVTVEATTTTTTPGA